MRTDEESLFAALDRLRVREVREVMLCGFPVRVVIRDDYPEGQLEIVGRNGQRVKAVNVGVESQ